MSTVAPPKIRTLAIACCVCGESDAEIAGRGRDFEYDTCSNEFMYVRCRSCGHCYLNPRPEPSELATIYPANYGNYSNSVNPGLAFRVKGWLEGFTLAKLAKPLPPHASVLDIGCGDGRLLDGLKRVAPDDAILEGIEISEEAAAGTRERGYTVTVGSVDELELPAGRYDLIALIQVIEHVFHPVACLEKIHAALKPGGRVLFETPSTRCLDYSLFHRRYWGGYHFPRHLNLFEPGNFTRLLEERGFVIESLKHKVQPVHWIWTLHHFFKEKGMPRAWTESFNLRNPFLLAIFSVVDGLQVVLLRRSSNMQIIARKIA